MSYLLQEIYGIENKNNQETKVRVLRRLLLPGLWVSSLLLPLSSLHMSFGTVIKDAFQDGHQVCSATAGTEEAQ